MHTCRYDHPEKLEMGEPETYKDPHFKGFKIEGECTECGIPVTLYYNEPSKEKYGDGTKGRFGPLR